MSESQVQTREQIEFEELNRWERHINNLLWTITSIFITINVLVISAVLNFLSTNNQLQYLTINNQHVRFGTIVSILFVLLWLAIFHYIVSIIRISLQLENRIVLLGRNWEEFSHSFGRPGSGNLMKGTSFWDALSMPWGKLTLIFTILFIAFWVLLILQLNGLLK